MANLARYINICQEMHLNLDNTITGTGFTSSALHIKAETSFLVTSLFGIHR